VLHSLSIANVDIKTVWNTITRRDTTLPRFCFYSVLVHFSHQCPHFSSPDATPAVLSKSNSFQHDEWCILWWVGFTQESSNWSLLFFDISISPTVPLTLNTFTSQLSVKSTHNSHQIWFDYSREMPYLFAYLYVFDTCSYFWTVMLIKAKFFLIIPFRPLPTNIYPDLRFKCHCKSKFWRSHFSQYYFLLRRFFLFSIHVKSKNEFPKHQ